MNERKYGIDLLRIASMFMILVLHILLRGGILDAAPFLSTRYNVAWIMKIACMCAVNCYGIISGYVSVDRKFRYYKIGVLWLQVVFYTLIITLLFYLFSDYEFTYISWTNSIFPVSTSQYWYFTSYFALFFFMPFYNKMLNSLEKKQLKALAITIVVLLAVLPTLWQCDIFTMKNGYSFVWLSMLYFIGGIIKKSGIEKKLNGNAMILCYIASTSIASLFKLLTEKYSVKNVNPDILTFYVSPTILAAAFFLFIFAVKMKINNRAAVKVISFLSPLSFSVYLIHTNTWVWYEFKDAFAAYAKHRAMLMFFDVIVTAVIIYLICSAIDILRFYIFKWLKITKHLSALEDKFSKNQRP